MGSLHGVKAALRLARRAPVGLCFGLVALLTTAPIARGAEAKGKQPTQSPSPAATRGAVSEGATGHAAALAEYGKLPLSFEPNRGQTDSRVKFLSHGPGYTLFLTPDGAVLRLEGNRESGVGSRAKSGQSSVVSGQLQKAGGSAGSATDNGQQTTDVIRLTLEGSNGTAAMEGLDALPGKTNYFLGNDPSKWLHEIPNYRRVEAREVYPGIGLTYYGTPLRPGQLEYDFVVAPGADPEAIRLAIETGNTKLEIRKSKIAIAPNGDLVIQTASGGIRFLKPVAYQEQWPVASGERPANASDRQSAIGNRQFVDGRYVLTAGNQVRFKLGRYDKTRPLVIDPVLSYSTYLGGSGIDVANGIAVGNDGTAFIAGGTSSTDFPTAHPLQPNVGGPFDFPQDAFVAKLSADGATLLYSTFLGGKFQDTAHAITVDTFGNAYVTGTTISSDFPFSIGSFKPNCGCDGACNAKIFNGLVTSDAFVVKLNPAGSAIDYSGAIGAAGNTQGYGIGVDINGNAYVTGTTDADACPVTVSGVTTFVGFPFPWTSNGFQTSRSGSADSFIVKVDPTGSSLPYASYLGGSGEDDGFGIEADNTGHAYVTGMTCSANFPTFNSLQPYGGNCDAFVTKANTLTTGGASLTYSTYLGGSAKDQGNAITLDPAHTGTTLYVTGLTNSTDFHATVGVLQPVCALDALGLCEGDAFVTKLSGAAVPAYVYSTYLGGTGADSGAGIAVDTAGNTYLTGITNSLNFPTAGTPFQASYGGGNSDAFVTKLNSTGTALVYSSYLGGSNADNGTAIALDTVGNAYVTGQTCSTNFPTHLPEQDTPGGNCDAFISKVLVGPDIAISPLSLFFSAQIIGTTSAAQTVTVTSNGDSPLILGTVKITGEFIQSNTCSLATLAPGATCTISVQFAPTTPGPQSGTLSIPDNVPGSPQTVNLSGLVTNVFVLPTQLNFGNQLVGTTSSPAQTVTLTNAGAAALTIFGINVSPGFAQNNDCNNSLPAGMSCTISVTFTPNAPGNINGTLTVTDSDTSSPQTVILTGHGNAPNVSVTPASLNFGTQGATGPAQTVTLTNNGDGPLVISNITVATSFAETSTCGTTLVAGASCTFSVTFVPTQQGTFSGQLTITDNNGGANGSTQTVNLSGTAVVPVASLAPTSLNFGPVIIGSSSTPQTVTVTNSGNANLTVANAVVGANYSVVNNCVVPLPPNTSCTLNVTFTPTTSGSLASSLVITDNAPGSPQSVGLTGLGINKFVTVAPLTLTFPNTLINTTSGAIPVTFSNTSTTTAVSITGINIGGTNPGDFAQSNNCGASVPASSSCTVNVTFTPTASGIRTGTLTFTDSDPSSPQSVNLTGNGTAPTVSLTPTTLNFGNQGATGSPMSVTLKNTGNGNLNITSITVSAEFSESDNCGGTVVPSGTCTINVSFLPTGAGAVSGTLTVADNAPNSPQTVQLSGNGVLPVATLTPTGLTFPSEPTGVTSPGQAVTLTNTGTATLTIASISINPTPGDFAQTNTCPSSLAPNAACSISVTFTPIGLGARTGTLTIADNAASSPQSVTLSGSGGDFTIAVAPTSATFFAGQSATLTVTLTPSFGFNGKVNLACSGLPSQSNCLFAETSATLNGTSPTNINVTVNSTARVTAPPRFGPDSAPPATPWRTLPFGFAALLLLAAFTARRLRGAGRARLVLATVLLMALAWMACGGGNPANQLTGTPAGNYTMTISGTSGSVVHSATVALKVN